METGITFYTSPGCSWIHFVMQGRPVGKTLRDGLMAALDEVESNGLTGWLSDLTESNVMDADDERWSTEVWLPRALGLGIKRIAILQPASIFAQMQAMRWETDPAQVWSELDYQLRVFVDVHDARHWLRGYEPRNSVLPGA